MTPKKLRNLLIGGLALILLLIGGIIYFASDFLQTANQETIHRQIDAELSAQDLAKLQSLENSLGNNQAAAQKAQQIVSDSKQYQYQDQIIKDIDNYAKQSGISISGYAFGAATDNSKSKSSKGAKTKSIPGVKSMPVDVSLDSPMPYNNFLRFLKLLEQNVSKMQVAGVNLTPDSEDLNLVANPSISLIVYVR